VTLPPKLCPECGEEFVHTVAICPDCGVTLVLELEPDAEREPTSVAALRRVRTATSSWARSFSERLSAAGIAHSIEAEPAAPRAGERASREERLYSVYVEPEDLETAARLDLEHLRSQIPDVPEELAAAAEDHCPACGEPADLAAPECASCGLAFRDAE
jgi:hypothetical protein